MLINSHHYLIRQTFENVIAVFKTAPVEMVGNICIRFHVNVPLMQDESHVCTVTMKLLPAAI